jgi:hypothetical protein
MQKLTKSYLIANVAERWKHQHSRDGTWTWVNSESIYNKLNALMPNATTEQIEEIIGNESWTRTRCDECERESELVIQVGEELDCCSLTAQLCTDCLELALKLARENT